MTDPQVLVQDVLARSNWGLLGTQGHILGLDVGSYGLRAALIDLHQHTYTTLAREPGSDDPDTILNEVIGLARELLAREHVAPGHLVRVGAGFAGPIDVHTGTVMFAPRRPGWENFPLKDRLEDEFDTATLIDNDANLIALAEAMFGAGHQAQHLVYIHLSSGVGSGLVLNRRVHHGATSTAGEIGHALIGLNDPHVPGQPPITLEQYLSIQGMLRRAAVHGFDTNLLSDIFSDHPIGKQIVAEAVEILAMRISQVIALLDPQLVVLGGVVARNGGDAFLTAIRNQVATFSHDQIVRHVEIVPSVLGTESVAIGGVALALESLRD